MIPDHLGVVAAIIVPVLGRMASNAIKDDGLKPSINALIAALALIIIAVICVWLAGSFTGNPQLDAMIVVGYVVLIESQDLSTLDQFFGSIPSPVVALVQHTQPTPPQRTPRPIRVPQGPIPTKPGDEQPPKQG